MIKKIITIFAISAALVSSNFVYAITPEGVTPEANSANDDTLTTPATDEDSVSNGGTYTPEAEAVGTDVPVASTTGATTATKSALDYSGWVQCDGVVSSNEPSRKTACNFTNLIKMVNYLINWVFAISIPVIIGIFAYAGFKLMTGREEALKEGKAMLWNAIIGFVIMLTAWFMVTTLLGWVLNSEFLQTATVLTGK